MPKRHSAPASAPKTRAKLEQPAPAPAPTVTPEVMTIQELALYLRLAVETLYKKVQNHEIPFTKVGNLLRFTKPSIDQWLARNTITPSDGLYAEFARLQDRYHFQRWLEGRGVDYRTLTDAQLTDLAVRALADLRTTPTP